MESIMSKLTVKVAALLGAVAGLAIAHSGPASAEISLDQGSSRILEQPWQDMGKINRGRSYGSSFVTG
jgi:hypothetical protein